MYPTTKFAVNGITKSLARELAPQGIRVNAVAPGIINTDMVANLPKEMIEPLIKTIPFGRIGEPEDIANAFLFLSSNLFCRWTGKKLKNKIKKSRNKEIKEEIIMSEKEIFQKLKTIVVDHLGVNEENVTMEATFVDDLAADSLDIVELVMTIEEEFDLEIPDSDAEKIVTIGDVVKYIEEHK